MVLSYCCVAYMYAGMLRGKNQRQTGTPLNGLKSVSMASRLAVRKG